MTLYPERVADILANADAYHRAYYQSEIFRGPSLYFHQRALQSRTSENLSIHLEYVYATLASWGMHRMGKGGSKMQPFDTFRRSVEPLKDRIVEAQNFAPHEMRSAEWATLNEVFRGIKVMASGTSLVGNSKVMHHMMPNIVPPIDREYTLRYLRENTNISNDLDWEWQIMKEIISDFFIPIACDAKCNLKAIQWMASQGEYPWDTSVLKIVDNLVIGSAKYSPELPA
jgi:hypothetical protein